MRSSFTHTVITVGVVCALPIKVAQAQHTDWARVIDVVPVFKHVPVTERVCTTKQVFVTPEKSGAGALMGAIAGGVIGSRFGKGGGNSAATAIGIIGGAMIGDRIEADPVGHTQAQQHCFNETTYQNVADGYRVTYHYAGRQYEVRTTYHPGSHVAIEVRPQISQDRQAKRRYKLAAHERRYN